MFSLIQSFFERDGLNKQTIGLLLSANGWLIVFLQLPVTSWLNGRDRVLVVLIGELIIGLGFGLTVFATTKWLFLATILIWTMGEIVQATFKHALVADLAPVDLRARYMGVFSLCFATAMTVGIPISSRVLQAYGPNVLWCSCTVVILVAGSLFGVLRYRLQIETTVC